MSDRLALESVGRAGSEIVVSSSAAEGVALAWDLETGTVVNVCRGNAAPAHGLAVYVGERALGAAATPVAVVAAQCLPARKAGAAQAPAAMIHTWQWGRENAVQRSGTSERVACVAVAPRAGVLAAGTVTGAVCVWDVRSGALLAAWDAHMKRVACVRVTPDAALICTAGDDAAVHAFALPMFVPVVGNNSSGNNSSGNNSSGNSNSGNNSGGNGGSVTDVKPLRSFTQHTLAVTDIALLGAAGAAHGATALRGRLCSVSLDHSLRVWDLATGAALAQVLFPTLLTAVACDPCARFVVVAAADGRLRRVDLATALPSSSSLPGASGTASSSSIAGTGAAAGDPLGPFAAAAATAAAAAARSQQAATLAPGAPQEYRGHTRPVTSVAVNSDGTRLVSASLDGRVLVWDTESRQPVLTFAGHTAAVSCVATARLPALIADASQPLALAPLSKHLQPRVRVDAGVCRRAALAVPFVPTETLAAHVRDVMGGPSDDALFDAALAATAPGADEAARAVTVQRNGDSNGDGDMRDGDGDEGEGGEAAGKDGVVTTEDLMAELAAVRESEARWREAANNLFQYSVTQILRK